MPSSIQQLIEGRAYPVTISPDSSLKTALDLMIQHDFSTLPIVDAQMRVEGIVTSDSILRGLHFTKTTTANLNVIDVKTDATMCLPDDDLFDVLERMVNKYACLVVDGEKCLVGIITDFDTSEYFRGRAENLMLVEDIEQTLKAFIRLAYPRTPDGAENSDLADAVGKIDGATELSKFKNGVAAYIKKANPASVKINPELAGEVFKDVYKPGSKSFDKLTMHDYIALFVDNDHWPKYKAAICLDKDAVFRMLDAVRQIRNDLAHFRSEVSKVMQEEQLRYCLQWLQRHQRAIYRAFPLNATEPQVVEASLEEEYAQHQPSQEVGRSRYAPLAYFLKKKADEGLSQIMLPFTEVEKIIRAELPAYARKHPSWWANDSVSRVQSKQWLNAGWRMKYVDVKSENVIFEVRKTTSV